MVAQYKKKVGIIQQKKIWFSTFYNYKLLESPVLTYRKQLLLSIKIIANEIYVILYNW